MLPENLLLNKLRTPVISGQTRAESWRRLQLKRLADLLAKHEKEILDVLAKDLGKPGTEAFFEVIALKQELKLAQQKLGAWMRPRRVKVPLSLQPGKAKVQLEPLGCVLIIGPWNYPFSLILQPLISALSAGNTAVLKPSEHAPATSALIASKIPLFFPDDVVQVVEGNSSVGEALLEKAFDHIFFTGGGTIGKKIMAAAAKHLTPVTLELGGKSPAIVLRGADLEVTARRIIWGKGLNAGQTCIAPDHLLVEENLVKPLLTEMRKACAIFYGQNPCQSHNLGRIVNDHHFKRLQLLVEGAQRKKQVLLGGEIDKSQKRISPTVIGVENRQDPLMIEELFGPLLPILKVPNFEKAIADIRQQPKPLAIYMFGGTTSQQQTLLETTSSGSVCFNDVVIQAGIPELPFGGVGSSGMGRYHGLAGFETFSHQKSVLERPFWLDIKFRYPPYEINLDLLKRLMN